MNDYLTLFNVTKESLDRLISIALSKGGDYADLFFEYSISNVLALRDNEVNAIASNIDYGVGIRVLKGDQTGYAYSESTIWDDMEKAALSAARIADEIAPCTSFNHKIETVRFTNRYPVISDWSDYSVDNKKLYLQEINDSVFSLDSRITKVMARLSDSETKVLFYNSLGDYYCDCRPIASIVATCILSQNGVTDTASASMSFRMGSEFLTESLKKEIIKALSDNISHIFEARQPKGGEMAVVMGAGGSGILLHEAIGHAFEADFIRKGTSIFSDKLGQQICSKYINVVDDATITANRGALNVDDEGVVGQKTYMVKDGVLHSFLHDRISAKYFGVSPTGNGRRESFRFNPIPRMRATYMENGNCSEDDIIKSIKKGIFVDNFTNGQVQIGAGDFTFFVKSGFLIENGRLTAPIKDINIIGNGPEALADIVAVADNCKIDNGTWTCGKDQYCYVSCGMPSVLVKSLTVGGGN